MPSRKVHRLADAILPGYEFVDAIKDSPSRVLGPGHRRVLHSHRDNLLLALLYRDPKVLIRAEIHDQMDRASTKMKRELRKMGVRVE